MSEKSYELQPDQWVDGELRLVSGLDARMMALLQAIDQTHSLNQAARQVGLSYKGAWQMIERANNASPHTLIITVTGGSKGGGSQLTPTGKRLLELFLNLQQQHQVFLRNLNQALLADPEVCFLLKPLAVKTSVTNQLFVTIDAIGHGEVQAELKLRLKGGEAMVAGVDMSTLAHLALSVGDQVLAMIPGAEILLLPNRLPDSVSARNQLLGRVLRIDHDGVMAEIALSLAGGDSLLLSASLDEIEWLRLSIGSEVLAVFKANAVILAVPEQ